MQFQKGRELSLWSRGGRLYWDLGNKLLQKVRGAYSRRGVILSEYGILHTSKSAVLMCPTYLDNLLNQFATVLLLGILNVAIHNTLTMHYVTVHAKQAQQSDCSMNMFHFAVYITYSGPEPAIIDWYSGTSLNDHSVRWSTCL